MKILSKSLSALLVKLALNIPFKELVKKAAVKAVIFLSVLWLISLSGCASATTGSGDSSGEGGDTTAPALLSISGFFVNDTQTEELQITAPNMEVRGTCESAAEGLGIELVLTADRTGNTVTTNTTCQSGDFAVTLNRGNIVTDNDGGLNYLSLSNVIITATANLTNDTVMSQPASSRVFTDPYVRPVSVVDNRGLQASVNIEFQDIYEKDGSCRVAMVGSHDTASGTIEIYWFENNNIIASAGGDPTRTVINNSSLVVRNENIRVPANILPKNPALSGNPRFITSIIIIDLPNNNTDYVFVFNRDDVANNSSATSSATYRNCQRVN